jgi:hypothetical protein
MIPAERSVGGLEAVSESETYRRIVSEIKLKRTDTTLDLSQKAKLRRC